MLAAAHEEIDRGAAHVARGGERLCALTHTSKSVDEMIRFVVGPNGAAVPDVKRKLPGRGIWITGSRAALDDAIKRNVFARGFKRTVRLPPDLAALTENLLERAALDALAIAGKSGAVVCGFAKVEAAIAGGDLVALIHSSGAATDGKRKIDALMHRQGTQKSRDLPIIDAFTGTQLDLALNRPNVVHAALLAGPVSETFLVRAMRLHRFRTGFAGDEAQINAPDKGVRGIET
ncbi:MAG TPA: RNA-binding protein [Pseudolabrys sp.]|nr:RNA-binding protein [Pseudolabrys sp.]